MKLVLFGDSLTFGYGVWAKDAITTLLKTAHPDWEIVNCGVNGDTTREALDRFNDDVLSHNPDAVTFLFGSNDCAMGEGCYRTLYEFNLNLEIMTEQLLLKNKSCKKFYITPPPVDDTVFMPWTYNDRLEPYCQAVRNIAEKYNGTLVDFNDHLKAIGKDGLAKYLQEDGCHLSELGYIEFFNCLEKTLKLMYND